MAEWGIVTWDSNGRENNYGLTPITVVGRISLAFEQVSGSYSFPVPAGFILDYIQCPTSFSYTKTRRSVTISGSSISIGLAGETNYGFGSESAQAAVIVFYVRKP